MEKTTTAATDGKTAIIPFNDQERRVLAAPMRFRADMDIVTAAELFAASGMFSDVRKTAQGFVKLLAGQELGVSPFAAMSGIYVIPSQHGNQVMVGGQIMAGKIKGSAKYDYDIVEDTAEVVEVVFWKCKNKLSDTHDLEHKGCKPEGKVRMTLDDMKAQGICLAKDKKSLKRNWLDSNQMLFWRAISKGTKRWFPDLLMGGAFITEAEQDEPITVPARVLDERDERDERPDAAAPAAGRHVDRRSQDDEPVVITDEESGETVTADPKTGEVLDDKAAEIAAVEAERARESALEAQAKALEEKKLAKRLAEELAAKKAAESPPKPKETTTEKSADKPASTPSIFGQRAAGTSLPAAASTPTSTPSVATAPAETPKPQKPAPDAIPDNAPTEAAPAGTMGDVLDNDVILASKIPGELLATVSNMPPEEEIANELWKVVHAWLVDAAPGKTKAEKNTFAMGLWTSVGITKSNNVKPRGKTILALVRSVGLALAIKKT